MEALALKFLCEGLKAISFLAAVIKNAEDPGDDHQHDWIQFREMGGCKGWGTRYSFSFDSYQCNGDICYSNIFSLSVAIEVLLALRQHAHSSLAVCLASMSSIMVLTEHAANCSHLGELGICSGATLLPSRGAA